MNCCRCRHPHIVVCEISETRFAAWCCNASCGAERFAPDAAAAREAFYGTWEPYGTPEPAGQPTGGNGERGRAPNGWTRRRSVANGSPPPARIGIAAAPCIERTGAAAGWGAGD